MPDILAKVQRLGVANEAELGGNLLHRQSWRRGPLRNDAIEEDFDVRAIGGGEGESDLKAPPDGAVEKFGVIAGGDDDDVARQLIELHQQEGHHTLDFAGLVRVTAFFADGVEFVEEEDAGLRPDVVE